MIGKTITINKRILLCVSFVYIYIPVFLFFFGWTNIVVSILCLLAVLYVIFRAYHVEKEEASQMKQGEETIQLESIEGDLQTDSEEETLQLELGEKTVEAEAVEAVLYPEAEEGSFLSIPISGWKKGGAAILCSLAVTYAAYKVCHIKKEEPSPSESEEEYLKSMLLPEWAKKAATILCPITGTFIAFKVHQLKKEKRLLSVPESEAMQPELDIEPMQPVSDKESMMSKSEEEPLLTKTEEEPLVPELVHEPLKINLFVLIMVVLFLLWISYYSGLGRYVAQTPDWNKHNAVLSDLVNQSWPVYYVNGIHHSMLVYYIGQYLLPAFIGKIFHSLRAAEVANFYWAVFGLVLVYLNLIEVIHSNRTVSQMMTAVVMVFFSIPLWLSELFMKRVLDINRVWEDQWFYLDDGIMLQYSPNFTLLRWVYAQTIVIWLIILLFYQFRDRIRYYAFLFLPGIIYGTIAFLGFIPVVAAYLIESFIRTERKAQVLFNIFSIENLVIVLTHGTVYLLYLYGNVLGDKPDGIGLQRQIYGGKMGVYLIFVGINILLYAFCIWKDFFKDSVFWGTIFGLLILPFFKMGLWNDLGMRASIPLLFLLMVYVLIYINTNLFLEKENLSRSISVGMLILLLIIGSFYEHRDLVETVRDNNYKELGNEIDWKSLQEFADPDNEYLWEDVRFNYYAYDIENNVFYKYIARNKLKTISSNQSDK